MNDLSLMIDLHGAQDRQGPGGEAESRLALTLSGLRNGSGLRIADIGCGTGASTLVLAKELDAVVTAIDAVPDFLMKLDQRAQREGLGGRIDAICASMEDLPFDEASLDAIWSEGAIYNMGFENGIRAWRRFLKPGGILAVSDLTWLTHKRPGELDQHWSREYPGVAPASAKVRQLEESGYTPIAYFPLPKRCWLDNFYRPLASQFDAFLARQENSAGARAIVDAERAEISLYERYSAFFSYGFYVGRKQPD